jgi:catechol 2,3-dioxygenase-like lactoylglutathione lyase family enzyme
VSEGRRLLFDHVRLSVRDVARSRLFYEQALRPLGVSVVDDPAGPGFTLDDQDLWIGEGEAAAASVHIAFAAADRQAVDAFYAAALGAGGVDNGPPGLRRHYHPGYYAAFVLDPDGHNIEAVFHEED